MVPTITYERETKSMLKNAKYSALTYDLHQKISMQQRQVQYLLNGYASYTD